MTSRISISTSSTAKSQVLIRRPGNLKPRPRTRLEDDIESIEPEVAETILNTHLPDSLGALSTNDPPEPPDDLQRIRTLLLPPPIQGVDDWGIPPEPEGQCDPAINVSPVSVLRRISDTQLL